MSREAHRESGGERKAGSSGTARPSALVWILERSGIGLWVLLGATALIAGVIFAWALHRTWLPVVRTAVSNWPGVVRCQQGRFEFPTDRPRLLAEGHDLALVLDPRHEGTIRAPAWVQVQWGTATIRVLGPFGEWEGRYPQGWTFERDPASARATWEAWEPVVLVGLALAVAGLLLLAWPVLAALYWPALSLVAGVLGKQAQGRLLWRIGLVAQLPGAWFMIASLFGFGTGWLNPLRLLVAFGLHWVLTWTCLAGLVLCLPGRGRKDAIAANPFAAALGAGSNPGMEGAATAEGSKHDTQKPD